MPSKSQSNLIAFMGFLLPLVLLAAGIVFLLLRYDPREILNPTPAKVSPAMVQGAWLNVVPREDAQVALLMGQCLGAWPKGVGDEELMTRTQQCEWQASRVSRDRDLVDRAVGRRLAATRKLWPHEPAFNPKTSFPRDADIGQIWQRLAQTPDEQRVVRHMIHCQENLPRNSGIKPLTARERAVLCEYSAFLLSGHFNHAAEGLVRRRGQATEGGWKPNPLLDAPVEDRENIPTPDLARAVDRFNASVLMEAVAAAWHDTRDAQETQAAKRLDRCLRGISGKLSTGVQLCELQGMAQDTSAAMDRTIARRNQQVTSIPPTAPRAVPAPTPPPTRPVPTPAAPVELTVPPMPPSIPLSPHLVIQAWMDTSDPAEVMAGTHLATCLNGMHGDIQTGVLICELRGLSANTTIAMDRTIARRAQRIPGIRGPGARAGTQTQEPPPAPQEAPPEAPARANTGEGAKAITAIDLPGARALLDEWQEQAGKRVAERVEACLTRTVPIVADERGLELAANTCKLEVQVEIEREFEAAKGLR